MVPGLTPVQGSSFHSREVARDHTPDLATLPRCPRRPTQSPYVISISQKLQSSIAKLQHAVHHLTRFSSTTSHHGDVDSLTDRNLILKTLFNTPSLSPATMDVRSLARPAAELLVRSRASLPLTTTRGHKTTSRTKRSLKIAPHDSFLPDRTPAAPAGDHIIYNPPSSAASPLHTPFIFLPETDPRRTAILRMRLSSGEGSDLAIKEAPKGAHLPPAMSYQKRTARYHLTTEDMAEMRRLRQEDPVTWSVSKLAKKFDCSDIIVRIAAPPPEGHKEWLKAKLERQQERWGPMKRKAREDRTSRKEMLYRGEI